MPQATNAGHSVEIEGQLYNLTLLGITDFEWLTNEMRREWCAMSDTEATRQEAYKRTILSPEGIDWVQSPTGMLRLGYRTLRHEHPDITLEQCNRWLMISPQPELWASVLRTFADSLPKPPEGSQKKSDEPIAIDPPAS